MDRGQQLRLNVLFGGSVLCLVMAIVLVSAGRAAAASVGVIGALGLATGAWLRCTYRRREREGVKPASRAYAMGVAASLLVLGLACLAGAVATGAGVVSG